MEGVSTIKSWSGIRSITVASESPVLFGSILTEAGAGTAADGALVTVWFSGGDRVTPVCCVGVLV